MTMVEQIARASFAHWRKSMDELGHHMNRPRTFDDMPEREHAFALDNARAMLEVLRNLTEEMKQAAARGVSDSFHEEGFQEGDDPSLWHEFVKAGERAFENAVNAALEIKT